jgi:hypothetical protein
MAQALSCGAGVIGDDASVVNGSLITRVKLGSTLEGVEVFVAFNDDFDFIASSLPPLPLPGAAAGARDQGPMAEIRWGTRCSGPLLYWSESRGSATPSETAAWRAQIGGSGANQRRRPKHTLW